MTTALAPILLVFFIHTKCTFIKAHVTSNYSEGKTIYSLYTLHSRILAGACTQID